MKFICLGYMEEKKFEEFSESERNEFIDACLTYDEELKKNGHFLSGEGLESSSSAKTLRSTNGKASATDGPFAETKEQLGGLIILEAEDLDHAVQLMSKHPSIRKGSTWEVRQIVDMSEMEKESEQRRLTKKES